jgi:GAF domain-containing protein
LRCPGAVVVVEPILMDKPQSLLRSASRLAALARTELLDVPPDAGLDRITKLATDILGSEVSLISFVEVERQFFVSSFGLPEPYATSRQTPLSHSFCQHVVTTKKPLVVEDARSHPVVSTNLAVTDLNVISYLGVPLEYHGELIGALCCINSSPQKWERREVTFLQGLAELIERKSSA